MGSRLLVPKGRSPLPGQFWVQEAKCQNGRRGERERPRLEDRGGGQLKGQPPIGQEV